MSCVEGFPILSILRYWIAYRRSGWLTGSGRRKRASTNRNAEVQAPIDNPSESTAAAVVTFRFSNCPHPKLTSARKESIHPTTRAW